MKTKPASNRAQISLVVDAKLRDALRKIAKAERRSLNAQVVLFLSNAVVRRNTEA